MDAAAAEVHRAKKVQAQRERRADEAAVRSVLDRVIVRVERQAQMQRQAQVQPCVHWQCPAGCTDFGQCARMSFRQQHTPSNDSVSASLRQLWEAKHVTPFGKFVGPNGCRYGFAEQVRCSREQEAELALQAPSFERVYPVLG